MQIIQEFKLVKEPIRVSKNSLLFGRKVELVVEATSELQYEWKRHEESKGLSLDQRTMQTHTLCLDDFSKADEGTYTCTVKKSDDLSEKLSIIIKLNGKSMRMLFSIGEACVDYICDRIWETGHMGYINAQFTQCALLVPQVKNWSLTFPLLVTISYGG